VFFFLGMFLLYLYYKSFINIDILMSLIYILLVSIITVFASLN